MHRNTKSALEQFKKILPVTLDADIKNPDQPQIYYPACRLYRLCHSIARSDIGIAVARIELSLPIYYTPLEVVCHMNNKWICATMYKRGFYSIYCNLIEEIAYRTRFIQHSNTIFPAYMACTMPLYEDLPDSILIRNELEILRIREPYSQIPLFPTLKHRLKWFSYATDNDLRRQFWLCRQLQVSPLTPAGELARLCIPAWVVRRLEIDSNIVQCIEAAIKSSEQSERENSWVGRRALQLAMGNTHQISVS